MVGMDNMVKYTVGEVIRRERRKQGLSQEQLSEGICTPSWLSKIESGSCIPTNTIFEALMQRLGKNASQYIFYKSELEMKIEHLKFEIRRYYATGSVTEATRCFNQLKDIVTEENKRNQQFILLYEILLFNRYNADQQSVLESLYHAVHITIPNFDYNSLKDYLLSKDEIVIINNIAILYRELGQISKAIELLTHLKQYLENPRFDFEERNRTYPVIMYNLAKWKRLEGDFTGCICDCDSVIEFCVMGDTFTVLPEILFNKGCALAELGGVALAKKCFVEAFHLFKIKKEDANAEHTQEYVFEKYKMEIS